MKPLDFDSIRSQIPAFFYKRIDLTSKPQEYFIIPIEYGFCYLLRSIRTKWNHDIRIGLPELQLFFIQQIADRTLQNERYAADLVCTPNNDGSVRAVAVPVVVPPDPNPPPFGINFTATPVKNNIILNYYYQRREALDLRVYFEPISSSLGYVDILFIGYYIPDKHLEMWE